MRLMLTLLFAVVAVVVTAGGAWAWSAGGSPPAGGDRVEASRTIPPCASAIEQGDGDRRAIGATDGAAPAGADDEDEDDEDGDSDDIGAVHVDPSAPTRTRALGDASVVAFGVHRLGPSSGHRRSQDRPPRA